MTEINEINDRAHEECSSRSDRTYVQADLALHSSRNEGMVMNGRTGLTTTTTIEVTSKIILIG